MINTAKIKTFFEKNFNIILFIIVFICVCFIYNYNNPTLNYFLKRGVALEYSVFNTDDTIEAELQKLNYKFLQAKTLTLSEKEFDSDNEMVEKVLFVKIPLLLDKKNAEKNSIILNNISDTIFKQDKNAKLINIITLGSSYDDPYSGFLKFLGLFITSSIIFLILSYVFFNKSVSVASIKENLKNFFVKQKNSFLNLIQKTKEKGLGYFLKRLLLDEEEVNKEEQDDKNSSFTREILSTVLFVLLCVIAIRYFVGELRWIPSGSMRPTILEKDRVFVEKLKYPKKEIKRGDILVFYPPEVELSNSPFAILSRLSGIFCRDIAFIKRTIGMPGDKFEIKRSENDGEYRVYINDIALNEPYISSKTNWTPCVENMYCGPFVIPKGHYFMMGDNRNNSQDSRFWGFLDENRVIGRANFMFFPIKRINVLKDTYIKLHKNLSKEGYAEADFIVDRY